MLVEKFNPVASLEQGAFELNRLSPLGDAIKRRSDPPFLREVPSIARTATGFFRCDPTSGISPRFYGRREQVNAVSGKRIERIEADPVSLWGWSP